METYNFNVYHFIHTMIITNVTFLAKTFSNSVLLDYYLIEN